MLRRVSVPSAHPQRARAGHWAAIFGALATVMLLAACVGPTVREDPESVGHYQVAVRIDPPMLQYGQKATLNYAFTDQATGKQVINLPAEGNTTVHATLVNHDLTWFRTGKAVGPVGGAYPVNLKFNDPDAYRVFVEFSSGYTPTERLLYTHTLAFGNTDASLEEPAHLTETFRQPDGTYGPVTYYGVGVTLDTGGALKAKEPATLRYTLTLGDTPVRDLSPFDGALGHLFIISADGEEFAHRLAREAAPGTQNSMYGPTEGGAIGSTSGNPESPGQPGTVPTPATIGAAGTETPSAGQTPTVGMTPSGASGTMTPSGDVAGPSAQATPNLGTGLGPDLTFEHEFEKPGAYKLWLQYLYHGVVVTADYVVCVETCGGE